MTENHRHHRHVRLVDAVEAINSLRSPDAFSPQVDQDYQLDEVVEALERLPPAWAVAEKVRGHSDATPADPLESAGGETA